MEKGIKEEHEAHGKCPWKEKDDDCNTPSDGKGEKLIKARMTDFKSRWFRK